MNPFKEHSHICDHAETQPYNILFIYYNGDLCFSHCHMSQGKKAHAGVQDISQDINNAANPGFPFNKQTDHIRNLLEEREMYYLLMAPCLSNYCLVMES